MCSHTLHFSVTCPLVLGKNKNKEVQFKQMFTLENYKLTVNKSVHEPQILRGRQPNHGLLEKTHPFMHAYKHPLYSLNSYYLNSSDLLSCMTVSHMQKEEKGFPRLYLF